MVRMPDWSYRTILRPLMLALGAERSRRLAVATLRRLSRTPGGLQLIDFLGHMRADGPISLGPRIDSRGDALHAFARFGVGMIEVGPVAERANDATPRWKVDLASGTIEADQEPVVSVDDVERNIADAPVPVCVHIAKQESAAVRRIVNRLQAHAAMFVVDPSNVADAAGERPVVARGDAGETPAQHRGDGIVIATGATCPADVKRLLDGGATYVSVDAGLVCSGPGFVKRCNDALRSTQPAEPLEPFTLEAARRSWFWAVLLGAAMVIGGLMALVIASTRVVLPYDESLCGLTREQMARLNPRLLPFMAHDRVSLAGTMLSIGVFYFALGWFGVRAGAHWAQVAVVVSGITGTLSFFTFLGFGYFDPFHAFVTAICTQFLLLCMVLPPSPVQPPPVAEWRETAAWRRGQWGQLLFILLGVGLLGAGIVITVIGCTRVFVKEDLEFMRTTAAQLRLSYDTLVPLVAHDRASLGGMLIANGLTVWLSAQWGFRAGAKWLWHALAWGGNLAFVCAITVHLVVGYDDWLHLLPAIAGWMMWNVALALTRGWLSGAQESPRVRPAFAAAGARGSGGPAPQ